MSSEAEETAPAAANTAEATTNANGEGKDNNKKNFKQRDETPIEELYDLSKPIPKVERPDKDAFEKELQKLTDEIESYKSGRAKVQEKIDEVMGGGEKGGGGPLQELRNELSTHKANKDKLFKEKQAMIDQMKQSKNQTDKLNKEKKDVRSNIKFNSVEDIDKEIAKLQRRQETVSMSLNEEKKLIKEIDGLKASKKYIADLKAKDTAIDDVMQQRKSIKDQITAKEKEIAVIAKKIDEIVKTLKAQNDKDSKKRETIQELFKERDEYRNKMSAAVKKKDALRAENREKTDAWFKYQRAVRAQKKIQYEEEKKRREEEKAAYLAKLEAEEAKKIPYEEEQALCDYLADYLERTYLNTGKSSEDKEGGKSKNDVVPLSDDPFAGMKAAGKKADEAEEYFGKGKGKKKRNRQKKQDQSNAGPFTLSVDSFEQFGLLQLTPPTSIEQVEKSVQELRAKKEWYKQQPRGSVPTAAQIRKENEKIATKLRQETEAAINNKNKKKSTTSTKQSGKKFSINEDEFVPLSASNTASSSVNASWGQQQQKSTDAPDDEAAAAEATAEK